MVRALFFLLIAFRVTVCPVVCASGGDLGYCCHGCSNRSDGGQKDEGPDAKPTSHHGQERAAAGTGCQCCSKEDCGVEDCGVVDCGVEDAACDRLAAEPLVSDGSPTAPAGEDGICSGDCVCKVLPEKGKAQVDSRTCFVIGSWNCTDAGYYATKHSCSSFDKPHAASPPDGKAVRISRCSLLI